MRNAFLSIAVAAALAAPALAQETRPAGAEVAPATADDTLQTVPKIRPVARTSTAQNARVLTPRTIDVPRNTLITSRGTFTLNADGSVKRQVASTTKGKAKVRAY